MTVTGGSSDAGPDSKPARAPVKHNMKPNLWDRFTLGYMTPLVVAGSASRLEAEDLRPLMPSDLANLSTDRFEELWQHEKRVNGTPRSTRVFWGLTSGLFIVASVLGLIGNFFPFAQPIVLDILVSRLQDEDTISLQEAVIYTSIMVMSPFIEAWAVSLQDMYLQRCGVRIQGGLGGAVFRKAMRLSPAGRHDVGNVVNLMSVDARTVFGAVPQLNRVWIGPLRVIAALVMLFQAVGPAALAGLAANVLMLPLYAMLGMRFGKIQAAKMEAQDERVKMMAEIIHGIKIIKCFTWEDEFSKRVLGVRKRELKSVYDGVMNETVLVSLISMSPMLSSLATFSTYAWMGEELTAARVFTAVALFGMIRVPLMEAPMAISALLEARVSVRRLWRFLGAAEVRDMSLVHPPPADTDLAMRVVDGTFSWEDAEGTFKDEGRGKERVAAQQKKKNKQQGNASSQAGGAEPAAGVTGPATGEGGAAGEDETPPPPPPPTLQHVNVDIAAGKLTCVVGKVASGKSSLMAALLGELRQIEGTLEMGGVVAYAAQTPWIFNATVRQNIILDKSAYDRDWYKEVINAAALTEDLEALVSGDHTEIGERGINLSGGQKQRVSVARALYNRNADAYMFDDPLSAVDGHVARHMFDNVFMKLLKGKTCVLVTQQMQFLRYAHHVVVMRDGTVWKQGTYDELLADGVNFEDLQPADDDEYASDGNASNSGSEGDRTPQATPAVTDGSVAAVGAVDVAVDAAGDAKADDDPSSDHPPRQRSASNGRPRSTTRRRRSRSRAKSAERDRSLSVVSDVEKEAGALTEEEARALGKVSRSTYVAYIKELGGMCFFVAVCMLFLLSLATMIGSDVWLGIWTNASDTGDLTFYLTIYFFWAVAHSIITAVKGWVFAHGVVRAALAFHNNLLANVLRAPLKYFHTTMSGRILNRFAKDLESIDQEVGAIMNTYFTVWLLIGITLIIIAVIFPLFAMILPVFAFLYYKLQRYYRGAALELNRLQDISRSPIYQHFGESIEGVLTLRAFKRMPTVHALTNELMDAKHRAYLSLEITLEWLSIRIGVLGAFVVGLTCATLIAAQDDVDPGLAGFAFAYSFQVFGVFGFCVALATWLEVKMNHVDRVLEYTNVEQEPPAIVPGRVPDAQWPQHGHIEFRNFSLRYRDNLPLVLNGVSLTIEAGSKVGIVGRTGAGKSSLVSALLRLYDGETGEIYIDGENLCTMGVKHVRQAVEIIVQEPVLFMGTIRSNVDTLAKHTDEEVWTALERVGMAPKLRHVSSKGLATVVESDGTNFSVGERQLLCMARSMLRAPKVLILDESTASVDVATDAMLQATVRRTFADATVLAIAHRINTIMDSDKIVVMDAGKIVEYDTPLRLLDNPDSIFASMVAQADNPDALRALATRGSTWGGSAATTEAAGGAE